MTKEGTLRLDCSDLLTVLLFLAAGWCHLAAHVPTVGVLRLLLSGFQDLWNTINASHRVNTDPKTYLE